MVKSAMPSASIVEAFNVLKDSSLSLYMTLKRLKNIEGRLHTFKCTLGFNYNSPVTRGEVRAFVKTELPHVADHLI